MQGGKSPTKAQQDWQNWQREQGCSNCGADNPAIHHCVGSTAKHNKVHIGQWWTIPLCYECHQGQEGIHHGMQRFNEHNLTRKEAEKRFFSFLENDYWHNTSRIIPDDVTMAIMDYHK